MSDHIHPPHSRHFYFLAIQTTQSIVPEQNSPLNAGLFVAADSILDFAVVHTNPKRSRFPMSQYTDHHRSTELRMAMLPSVHLILAGCHYYCYSHHWGRMNGVARV